MRIVLFIISTFFISCKQEKQVLTAQQIIDASIQFSGSNKLHQSQVSFQFRDKFYTAKRNKGTFGLIRSFDKDSAAYKDILSNNRFQRFIDDSLVSLTDKKQKAYSNSINSVHYFAVLPYGLNDSAVHKKRLSIIKIKGIDYYKVKVTFSKENGGEDFDDVFLYWFQKENFQLDYFAYKYSTNGGGIRFRDVKSEIIVNGIRFANYNNYKPKSKNINFLEIDSLYIKKQLQKISEIDLKDINVVLF